MADTSGTECSNRQIQDNPEQEKTGKSFDFPAVVDQTPKISNLLEDIKKVERFVQSVGLPVIPTLIPTLKVVRKPGLVVRKIEKVGRKAYLCCVKRVPMFETQIKME